MTETFAPGTRIIVDGVERTIRAARVILPEYTHDSRYGGRSTTWPAQIHYDYEGPFEPTPASIKAPRQTTGNSGAYLEAGIRSGLFTLVTDSTEVAA